MKPCLSLFIVLLLSSCNTYKFASHHTAHVLEKNGLTFHTLETEKYKITYWDSGSEKPVLILIHGFGTSGKFQWFKQASELSNRYRLVIFNMLYFGSKPKTPVYTVEGQSAAVEELLEHLHIDSYYLCGTSYGGLVAAELALKYPGRIKKLVLMDVPLKYLTEQDVKKVCEQYKIPDQEELFVPSNPGMLKKLLNITYVRKSKMPVFLIRSFYNNTYEEEKDNLRKIYESLLKENTVFNSKNYHFKMPVLLVWGESDRLVPVHVGQQLKEELGANAQLEIVPHAAHLPNLENDKTVNKLLISFLSR